MWVNDLIRNSRRFQASLTAVTTSSIVFQPYIMYLLPFGAGATPTPGFLSDTWMYFSQISTFWHCYRSRRRPRRNGRDFSSSHSQAAVPVLLSNLLWDSQLSGEALGGRAAASRGGACPAQRGTGNTEEWDFHTAVSHDFKSKQHHVINRL